MGAKFAPCMRKDKNIMKEIEKWREKERETACCIRNDDSGCIQASKEQCTVRYKYLILINKYQIKIYIFLHSVVCNYVLQIIKITFRLFLGGKKFVCIKKL